MYIPRLVICFMPAMTQQLAFDVREEDTYWCTADIGWVTGHSYIVYGPLCNGHSSILFEGVPNYPDFGRFWAVVEKYNVNNFYTAPTAIRSIAKEGDKWVDAHDISSLRVLGSVGEPLNPEAWWWYYNKIGGRPLHDFRYLVADGNRRTYDPASARRNRY